MCQGRCPMEPDREVTLSPVPHRQGAHPWTPSREEPCTPKPNQTMAFQTLNINGRIRMNSRVMNENGREGWTEKTYQDKNQEKGNHYNFARHNLNFEIVHGGAVQQLDDALHVPIEQRLNQRLKELGFNYYKEDSKNAPYSCVDIIVGGDHELMSDIAFGNGENIEKYFKQQETEDFFMGFYFEEDNMNLFDRGTYEPTPTKKPKIIQWAEDNYRFFCDKFGEENIISFSVHLDETTPHAHVLAIPTAMKKQRGRVKSGAARKAKEVVSFKSHFGDLTKANSRKAAYQKWHDDYYQAVGKKWGFERGRDLDKMSPEERAQHTHLHKTELDMRNRLRAEIKALQEQKNQLDSSVAAKKDDAKSLDAAIIQKRMRYNSLSDSVLEKASKLKNLQKQVDELTEKKTSTENSLKTWMQTNKNDLITANKAVINEMYVLLFALQHQREDPEQRKKRINICSLAAALYLHLEKRAQKILNEVNGQKVVSPAPQDDDRKTRIACLIQAEKLINLPKVEQEQERGRGFGR